MKVGSWFFVKKIYTESNVKQQKPKAQHVEAGFSLAALLVAVAIMGILGYVMSSIFANQAKAQKKLDLQVARLAIVRNLNARIRDYCPQGQPTSIAVPASCTPDAYLAIPSATGGAIISLYDPANPLNAQKMNGMRVRAKCKIVDGLKTLKVEAVDEKKLEVEPNNEDNWKDVSPNIPLPCNIQN